jgi:folate-binding protein YgfZ
MDVTIAAGIEAMTLRSAVVSGTHEMVEVTGPGARSFVQSLISQDLDSVPEGSARRSFLLGPKGKLRALLWVWSGPDRVALVADAGYGERVAADLAGYRIRVKAQIAAADPPVMLCGPESAPPPGSVSAPLGDLQRWFSPVASPGATPVSPSVWERLRIEAGEPVMGRDVDEDTIPQETGLVSQAVSFDKGCYLGQELVARIDSRGHVNRRLVRLEFAPGAVTPPPGALLTSEAREVGRLGTTAAGPPGAPVLGLALVRREIGPGQAVSVEGLTATVSDLPAGAP